MAGVDEQGRIKELLPREEAAGAFSRLRNFKNRMANLTPESQAMLFLENLSDNLVTQVTMFDDATLSDIERGEALFKHLNQYAGIENVEVGQAGEALLGSPITATTAAAVKAALNDPKLQNHFVIWAKADGNRKALRNLANVMKLDPAKLLDELKSNPEDVFAVMLERARNSDAPESKAILEQYETGTLTPDVLSDRFASYVDGSQPWDFRDFRTRVVNHITDVSTKWTIDNFGVKQLSTINRVAALMKSMQSLLLLDLNPTYLANNALNNWVTRAAEGVFGFMTPRQVQQWTERMGVKPYRLEEGYSPSEYTQVKTARGFADIREATMGDDRLARLIKQVNRARNKFGLVSKLSAKLESSEGTNAYVIGAQRMWDRLHRPGVGYRPMSGPLETMLAEIHPSLPDHVYSLINSSMNADEIESRLYSAAAEVNVNKYVDRAAKAILPDNPDLGRDILKATGISTLLSDLLKNAKTSEDVDRAMAFVDQRKQDFINRKVAQDMAGVKPEVVNRIKNEGFQAGIDLFGEVQMKTWEHEVARALELADMFDNTEGLSPVEKNSLWREFNESDAADWKRVFDFELQVYDGVLETLGVGTAEAEAFSQAVQQRILKWQDAHSGYYVDADGVRWNYADAAEQGVNVRKIPGKYDLQRAFFTTKFEDTEQGWAERNVAYNTMMSEIQDLMDDATQTEKGLRDIIDNTFADMFDKQGGSREAALAWRKAVNDIRDQMIARRDEFFRTLREVPLNKEQRRRLGEEFRQDYIGIIAQMRNAEMVGAQELAGMTPAPRAVAPDLTPKPEVEPVKSPLAEAAENVRVEAGKKYDALLNRDQVLAQMQRAFNATADEINAVRVLMDLYAEQWAKRTGQSADDWFRRIAGVEGGEAEGLFQKVELSSKEMSNLLYTLAEIPQEDYKQRASIIPSLVDKTITAYHVTSSLNIESINKNGLFAKSSQQSYERPPAVYMFLDEIDVSSIEALGIENPQVLEISIPINALLKNGRWDGLHNMDFATYSSVQYLDNIPAKWIQRAGGLELYQSQSDIIRLANAYGIPTATKTGKPNDRMIINIVKKYGGEEAANISKIEDITTEMAERAFEERRIAKGEPAPPEVQAAKGGVKFLEDGRAVIKAMGAADISTVIHELGHIFRRDLSKSDIDAVAKWAGLTDGAELQNLEQKFDMGMMHKAEQKKYAAAEEKFARAFEKYLAGEDIDAPPKVKTVFAQMRDWLLKVYKQITGSVIDIEITPEIKDVFDRMLFDDDMRNLEETRIELLRDVDSETLVRNELAERDAMARAIQDAEILDSKNLEGLDESIEIEPEPEQIREEPVNDIASRAQEQYRGWKGKEPLSETEAQLEKAQEQATLPVAEIPVMPENIPGKERRFGYTKDQIEYIAKEIDEELKAIAKEIGIVDEKKEMLASVIRANRRYTMGDVGRKPLVIDVPGGSRITINSPLALFKVYQAITGRIHQAAREIGSPKELKPRTGRVEGPGGVAQPDALTVIRMHGGLDEAIDAMIRGISASKHDPNYDSENAYLVLGRLDNMKGKLEEGKPIITNDYIEYEESSGRRRRLIDTKEELLAYAIEKQGNYLFQPSNTLAVNNPLGSTPVALFEGFLLDEINQTHLQNLLKQVGDEVKRGLEEERQINWSGGVNLPDSVRAELQKYINGVKADMPGTKLASINYGRQMRDMALLNYNKRYGFDHALNFVFPYQFWYTRTMLNWAQRMIDKPSIYSMYVRLREMQRRQEEKGVPTRLRGKMRIPAPFLPEWMGGALYTDPFKQLFPFDQFAQPLDFMRTERSGQYQRTVELLQEELDYGRITKADYSDAVGDSESYLWSKAWAQAGAEIDSRVGNPVNLVSQMMGPALYLQIPNKMLRGKPEEISQMPVTRTGQAIESAFRGTPLSMVGSAMAAPERWGRQKFNLDEFGEWGDYYVDRQLSNMAAEGTIDTREALYAMMERQGPAYNEAVNRVRQELSLRTPGVATIEAMRALTEGRATGLDVLLSVPGSLFSYGLLPQGEIEQRGLKEVYNKAWELKKSGQDPDAVNEFFEQYPEYQTRTALFDEPEERLRNFLVSEIWDRYTELEGPNKDLAREQLGDAFAELILDKETRDYTAIDMETLAYWAQVLGSENIPETARTSKLPLYMREQMKLNLYAPAEAREIQQYWDEAKRLFGENIYNIQSLYFDNGRNPAILEQYPQLRQYWEWKKRVEEQSPIIKGYNEAKRQEMGGTPEEDDSPNIPPEVRQYWEVRDRMFPNIQAIQSLYFAEGVDKRAVLEKYPQLKEYWGWKDKYEQYNPVVAAYNQQKKMEYELGIAEPERLVTPAEEDPYSIMDLDSAAVSQLYGFIYSGQSLTQGALMELHRVWENNGRPDGSFDKYLETLKERIP
jgi:hypothetical protein